MGTALICSERLRDDIWLLLLNLFIFNVFCFPCLLLSRRVQLTVKYHCAWIVGKSTSARTSTVPGQRTVQVQSPVLLPGTGTVLLLCTSTSNCVGTYHYWL